MLRAPRVLCRGYASVTPQQADKEGPTWSRTPPEMAPRVRHGTLVPCIAAVFRSISFAVWRRWRNPQRLCASCLLCRREMLMRPGPQSSSVASSYSPPCAPTDYTPPIAAEDTRLAATHAQTTAAHNRRQSNDTRRSVQTQQHQTQAAATARPPLSGPLQRLRTTNSLRLGPRTAP